MNDLFQIKLICLRSESWIVTFSIWVDATLSSISSFKQFLLIDATDRKVLLVAIKSAYFSPYAYTPFHFSQTLPLSGI